MNKKKHSASSNRWLKRHQNDIYFKEAKKKKLRSRAWFKLKEIQQNYNIFKPGMTIIDLGSTPGSWSKYVINKLNNNCSIIACDLLPMKPIIGVNFLQGDFRDKITLTKILSLIDNKKADVIMSDMLPNMSGIASIDIPASIHLSNLALNMCHITLKPKGNFIVKILNGDGFQEYFKNVNNVFIKTYIHKPKSSRKQSREQYIIATGLKI
ncbi:Ribosomal RNA large subunit methyltransferase E [Candidatus Providencia siddallii]|uniref:Ribosomal RNA large subunit methyltransferase E n=1 Tax=Candidatus Providencia siddallii TaxID=1715285 RepID=A0ABP1CE42_9GAMM